MYVCVYVCYICYIHCQSFWFERVISFNFTFGDSKPGLGANFPEKDGNLNDPGVLNGLLGGRFSDKTGEKLDVESVYLDDLQSKYSRNFMYMIKYEHTHTWKVVIIAFAPQYAGRFLLLTCLFMD